MSYIISFETLDENIQATGGLPTVLEALWDGDTDGWFLVLTLYAKTGNVFWGSEERHHLGIVKVLKDQDLFNGEAPLWPEAKLAREWGKKAVERYGLTFYFPSENEPDDNCPKWTERHYGFPCLDCGKLIRLRYSEYVPHDVCAHCNSKRERNEKLKRNEVYKDAVFGTYVAGDGTKEKRDYSLCHYLHAVSVRRGDQTGEAGMITFNNEELVELKNKLYNKIKSNESHRDLSSLLDRYKTFEQAASEGWTYYLHIIKGITDRDDAVLRFINYVGKGFSTLKALSEQFANVLTEEEVLDTLKKLEGVECVEKEGDVIKLTIVGQGVLF